MTIQLLNIIKAIFVIFREMYSKIPLQFFAPIPVMITILYNLRNNTSLPTMACHLLYHLVFGPLILVIVYKAHGVEYRNGIFYSLPNTYGYLEALDKVVAALCDRFCEYMHDVSHPIINDMFIPLQQPNPLVRRRCYDYHTPHAKVQRII